MSKGIAAARRKDEQLELEAPLRGTATIGTDECAKKTWDSRDEVSRIIARIRAQLSRTDRVLLFTGVTRGDGASELARETALALSKLEGERILLVDTAISTPSLHKRFDISISPGLAEAMSGDCSLTDAVQPVIDGQLYVMPAGNTKIGPGAFFAPPELARVMQVLRSEYRFVVLSTPPVLTDVSASLLSSFADGVILAVSSGSQRRGEVLAAQNELRSVKAKMLGAVLCEGGIQAETFGGGKLDSLLRAGNPSRPAVNHAPRRGVAVPRTRMGMWQAALLAAAVLISGVLGASARLYASGAQWPQLRLPLAFKPAVTLSDTPVPPVPPAPVPEPAADTQKDRLYWVSAKPDAVPAQPEENKQADPSPPPPVRPRPRSSEAPSGNLVVYQDGKVIFRLKPSEDVGPSGTKSGETTSVLSQTPGEPSATDPALGLSEKTFAQVLQRVEPEYPEAARQQHIQGQIVFEAYVGKDGAVQQLMVISGNSMLATAASAAVRQWRFKPLVQNGRVGEFQIPIKVHFVLP